LKAPCHKSQDEGVSDVTTQSWHTARAAIVIAACALLAACHTKETLGNDHSALGTEHVCSSCHGMEGRSENPTFPNLAGQQKAYIVNQLKAFRGKTRADPHARTYMFGMAAKLDNPTIEGLASFYAAQKPAAAITGDPSQIAVGEKIFKSGIASAYVPACFVCHGKSAAGRSVIPRLADQHAAYIIGQLHAFQVQSRANVIMHANAIGLTDPQIEAIAAYLASI